MKKISWGCVVIGMFSIILSVAGISLHPEVKGYNLPFQILIISLNCGAIAVPKLGNFIDIFRLRPFDYIFTAILVVSGIGTLRIKSWGRIFAYIYAKSIIFLSIIGMLVILPGYLIMYDKMSKQGSLALLPVYAGGGYLLTFFGALLYPVIILIFFSRPKIKEMFSTEEIKDERREKG